MEMSKEELNMLLLEGIILALGVYLVYALVHPERF